MLLDQIPRWGAMKNAIECATGKDFITETELSPNERVKCAIGAVAGIEDFVPSNMEIEGLTKVGLDVLNMVDLINSEKEVLEREGERDKELNRNRNRSRSRDKSKSKKGGRDKEPNKNRNRSRSISKDKSKSKKGGRGKGQRKKK